MSNSREDLVRECKTGQSDRKRGGLTRSFPHIRLETPSLKLFEIDHLDAHLASSLHQVRAILIVLPRVGYNHDQRSTIGVTLIVVISVILLNQLFQDASYVFFPGKDHLWLGMILALECRDEKERHTECD
jgi:hypothetical protein